MCEGAGARVCRRAARASLREVPQWRSFAVNRWAKYLGYSIGSAVAVCVGEVARDVPRQRCAGMPVPVVALAYRITNLPVLGYLAQFAALPAEARWRAARCADCGGFLQMPSRGACISQ